MTETLVRFVKREQVADFIAAGWRVVPVRRVVHHDAYSVMMERPAPEPPRAAR